MTKPGLGLIISKSKSDVTPATTDGNVYEMAYDRAGARISEQSEGAAAVVVGL